MKKKIKIFGVFIAIALVLQTCILLVLNYKVFAGFKPSDTVIAENNKQSQKSVDKTKEEKKISIESDAKELKISHDNNYISYINKDNKLSYIDIQNNKNKVIDDIIPVMYRWSENNLVIVGKNETKRNAFDFYEYNTKTQELNKLQTLSLTDRKGTIEDIKCSPFKTLIFVHVKNYGEDQIYKLNVKNEFDKVDLKINTIDKIAMIPHEDKIIYNSGKSDNFYITYVDKKVVLQEEGKKVLLGVDNGDKIYIGIEQDNKIKTIYSGRMTESIASWKKNDLAEPIDEGSLYINGNSIYKVDNQKLKVTDLTSNKEESFEGKFISIDSNTLIYNLDNQIKIKKLAK